jgi:sarcosine oxidase delta subunit
VLALTATTAEEIVMATPTLPPRPSYVLITLARQSARWAVKDELRAQGLKSQLMRASEIAATADLYFKANARALVEEAWRTVQGCPDLMRFYEKEQKDRAKRIAQNSEVLCKSEITAAQALPLLTTHAQNGAAK